MQANPLPAMPYIDEETPLDVLQQILSHRSLHWLYERQETCTQFFILFNWRCKTLSAYLVNEAQQLFLPPTLITSRKLLHRTLFEWNKQWDPLTVKHQLLTDLHFEGPGAEDPFPITNLCVNADGSTSPYNTAANTPTDVLLPGRVSVFSHRGGLTTLRDATCVRFNFRHARLPTLQITLHHEEGDVPSEVIIDMTATTHPHQAYTAFCGVILALFCMVSPDAPATSSKLQQSMLAVRLPSSFAPQPAGPGQPLSLPQQTGDALTLVYLRLQEVVPSSRFATGYLLQHLPLQQVIN
jgi:hypothetical protein